MSEATVSKQPEFTRWQKLRLVGLVVMKRVRFIAILAAVGSFIAQWDNIKSRWDRWTRPRAAASRELPPDEEFYCAMEPQVVRSAYEPNGDVPLCPICGMPLSIHRKGHKEELAAGIAGRVRLSPERVQMAGIRTVAVEYRPAARRTKTVGYVTYDESRLSRVVSRYGGYVEKLYVDKTYAMVRKGDRVAEIYSPEFYSAAKELILNKRFDVDRDVADSEKLLMLGVSEEDLREIAAAKEPPRNLTIRAPQSGFVVQKNIVAGASIEPKMTLLEIADLSSVWLEADVYETDIAFLQPGQKVAATVEAYPNRTFTGEVDSIYPRVEATTRTNRIRVRLDNPGNELRPGMYAAVTIDTPLETIEPYKTLATKTERTIRVSGTNSGGKAETEFITVPEQAVVDTGAKKIVYVERHEGEFEGVEVELGPRQDDLYPVLKGLSPGDRVVAAGGFLVDAEARLNPAAAVPIAREPVPETVTRDTLVEVRPRAATIPAASDIKNIEQLPQEDWQSAKAQAVCPVTGNVLGLMGIPVKITLRGKPVYLCCKNCIGKAKRDPEEILKKLKGK